METSLEKAIKFSPKNYDFALNSLGIFVCGGCLGGFVQEVFVRRFMSRGFCPRGLCPDTYIKSHCRLILVKCSLLLGENETFDS